MKIELVGGPMCGDTMRISVEMERVCTWDWQGGSVTYKRRDVSTSIAPMYGAGGNRMYDYVRAGVSA